MSGASDGAQGAPVTVSTHILDTRAGRPASGVTVQLSLRTGGEPDGTWSAHGVSRTNADGRCADFPALPEGAVAARLRFETGPYLRATAAGTPGDAFFPEVTVAFAVTPGEHYHVPLLLSPFGYSVYRGS
ncbi:hydroxyisourate hydrolase [Streptomyces sp. AJS327]|uniref:hydroxyisourate hydrolase n=1 Tax=Streptomyces sp. AJS327 TaxID=2545265 RepID=UPI0015DD84A6|nr:hydroxyisourate hydrolase [Streptomyces sp. AJS327]MBA0052122.1 hydroxyisourate hydrolase [Streptomyces sp. AJS327]